MVDVVTINFLIALTALSVSVYGTIIHPKLLEKPEVTVTRSPHWISSDKDEALHEFVFRNAGNAPAQGLGIHFELQSKFKIKSVSSDKPWIKDKQVGGEGESTVELKWDELPPANLFHVWFIAESSPDINDLFPAMYKVWYKDKLVDKFGTTI